MVLCLYIFSTCPLSGGGAIISILIDDAAQPIRYGIRLPQREAQGARFTRVRFSITLQARDVMFPVTTSIGTMPIWPHVVGRASRGFCHMPLSNAFIGSHGAFSIALHVRYVNDGAVCSLSSLLAGLSNSRQSNTIGLPRHQAFNHKQFKASLTHDFMLK